MDSRIPELATGAVPSMNDRDFDVLRGIVREVTGIVLADSKRTMLASRLVTRLRRMNLSSFSEYREALADPGVFSEERQAFINAVTTNKTSFFREPHQFEVFAKQVIPEFVQRAEKTGQRRVRIWSAACSTGEEPWTLSMVLRECLPSPDSWDVKILASDIDTDVLAKAGQGLYDAQHIEGLSRDRIAKHFTQGRDGSLVVNDALKRWVAFRQLNFMDATWPIRTRFDVVMCRNASIYFDQPTQKRLFGRLADLLEPRGHLFVGHAEVLHWPELPLEASPGGVYRLKAGYASPPLPTTPLPSRPSTPRPRASAPVTSPGFDPLPPPPRSSAPRASAPRASAPRASAPVTGPGFEALPPTPAAARPSAPRPSAPRGPAPSAPRSVVRAPEGFEVVVINVGEMHASGSPVEIKTLLGSCVAACLFDPSTGIGGMNHFLLPDSADAGSDPARFGVHAMEMLINALMKLGADRRRLEGKLFGGGNVLGSVAQRPTVGERNSTFAREFLAKEHIPLVAERLRSDCGTEVRFWAHTGRVFIRDISTSLLDLSRERKPVLPAPKGGDVELF